MRKILFIDDEEITARALISCLERFFEFQVIALQDYRQMDNELQKGCDAVVLDIMMPILENYFSEKEITKANSGIQTGIVLFDKIRKQYPQMPIMFYSAHYSAKQQERMCCDEWTVFLKKPELAQSIAKALNDLIERVSNT
jgi:CheY-like chemotaxis protein